VLGLRVAEVVDIEMLAAVLRDPDRAVGREPQARDREERRGIVDARGLDSLLQRAGLDLEALVVRLTRARATVIIAVIGVVLVYLGLLAPTIQGAIGAALLVLAELSAPWAVIVGIDFLKTGGHYDADDLQVFNRGATGGAYWYSGGWHPGAVVAWAVGSVVGLLTIQTQIFSGPLSGIALGVDVSLLLGALVAAVIYLPLRSRTAQRV